MGSGQRSVTFIFLHTPQITASYTCFNASPNCYGVTNCWAKGRSTEFSLELQAGEVPCPPKGSQWPHAFPYLLASTFSIECQPFCRCAATDGVNLFQKKITWWVVTPGLTCDWRINWLHELICTFFKYLHKGRPWVFFPRKVHSMLKLS